LIKYLDIFDPIEKIKVFNKKLNVSLQLLDVCQPCVSLLYTLETEYGTSKQILSDPHHFAKGAIAKVPKVARDPPSSAVL
jgi:hypothetical protein